MLVGNALERLSGTIMTTAIATLSEPLDCEGESQEQQDAHIAWIQAELTRRMNANEEYYPHDQVMAEMKAIIESKRKHA